MTATQIAERFAELETPIDEADVESRIKILTDQFNVPTADAESSVVSFFLRKTGVERAAYYADGSVSDTRQLDIVDIPVEDGVWMNLRGKVVDIYESEHESITQTGYFGDETGRIKFVIWANSGLSPMVKDKVYSVENVVTNLYNERVSFTFNKTSTITELEEVDIELYDGKVEFVGVLVGIKNNSGLIKRCPECNRAMIAGSCNEHGAVEGIHDLRIMGYFDDGESCYDIVMNAEATSDACGLTMEDAKGIAFDNMDAGAVLEEMRKTMVGKYYKLVGSQMDDSIFVSELNEVI